MAKRTTDQMVDTPLVLSEANEVLEEGARQNVFDVLVIRPGTSKNRRRYSRTVLQESAPLLDGARSFMSDGPDHDERKRGVGALVGWWSDPRYESAVTLPDGKVAEGIVARYHVTNASLAATLRESLVGGRPDLIGFSIVANGQVRVTREGGSPIIDVRRIDRYESVDPVINAAAGGVAVRLVASTEVPHDMEWATLSLAEAVKAIAAGEVTIDEVKTERADLADIITAGKVAPQVDEAPAPVAEAAPAPQVDEAPIDVAKIVEAQVGPYLTKVTVERVLADEGSRLPDVAKARIREATDGRTLSEQEVRSFVKAETDYLAKVAPAAVTQDGPVTSDHKSGEDRIKEALDDVLSGKGQSIRDVYVTMTGDRSFTGKLQESTRLSEAIDSTTFAQALGDSITRQMVAEYARMGLDSWKQFVDVVPVNDFRTQRRVRLGGYGNLPGVNEAAAYSALTSPGDEEATYAPTKRGGTESVTLETIANDDVGTVRRIPTKLARAAAQTLHEFAFEFINANPTIYDAVALFHASHSNLGAAALDATTLSAGRLAMLKQAEAGSSKRLGIQPRYLVVPVDLEQTAYQLTQTDREVGNGNNTLNFARTWGLSVITVPYWTDANNWYLVADKASIPTIEIGFLGGREEPELFLADAPTVGSMFTNDQLVWKIRHIYGGAVLDYRGFYGAVVV